MEKDFMDAAYYNDVDKITSLLNQGIDINYQNKDGSTALFEAVTRKNYESVEKLLESGADTSKQYYQKKYTILHIPVADNDSRMTALLLKYMSDINGRDKFGNTPLWTAVHQASLLSNAGNTEIVEMLLKKGADPYTPNWIGKMTVGKSKEPVGESLSPYDSAVRSKLSDVLALIEKYAPKSA